MQHTSKNKDTGDNKPPEKGWFAKLHDFVVGESFDFPRFLKQVARILSQNDVDAQELLDFFGEYDKKEKRNFADQVIELHHQILFELIPNRKKYDNAGIIWVYAKCLQ